MGSFQCITYYKYRQMGNICCEDPPNDQRNRREIVPTYNKYAPQFPNSKTQEQLRLQQQKMLLRDYSFAVINLKKNEIDHPRQTYKGVYTHNSISSDEISEYFTATLVELNDDFKTCIVKKIIKERLNAPFLKKGISIEYLVTSYHRSNFIVRNMFFFEDFSYLYLYFDLQNYIHLNIFSFNPLYLQYFRDNLENNIKFIIAGVILGLEELHNLRIVYRGINNDNIVIRENGYPLLTNLACLHPEGQPLSIVYSTPFTSPEQFRNQPITRSTDFWSLGVLIYNMITGSFPNFASFQQSQFYQMGISPQLCDLINRLLIQNPAQRLGVLNLNDLKVHSFFYGFDWQSYARQELQSPFSREQNRNYPPRVEEQQYDYHEQQRFDNGYSTGGLMAGMLFMEIGTLLLISSMFEHDYMYQQPIQNYEAEVQQGNLPHNQFQEGCAIELSEGSNEDLAMGGDYD